MSHVKHGSHLLDPFGVDHRLRVRDTVWRAAATNPQTMIN